MKLIFVIFSNLYKKKIDKYKKKLLTLIFIKYIAKKNQIIYKNQYKLIINIIIALKK